MRVLGQNTGSKEIPRQTDILRAVGAGERAWSLVRRFAALDRGCFDSGLRWLVFGLGCFGDMVMFFGALGQVMR